MYLVLFFCSHSEVMLCFIKTFYPNLRWESVMFSFVPLPILFSVYFTKSEADYVGMRPPRTDVAGLTISEGLLRTAKLEETVTEGQNVNLASQGQLIPILFICSSLLML